MVSRPLTIGLVTLLTLFAGKVAIASEITNQQQTTQEESQEELTCDTPKTFLDRTKNNAKSPVGVRSREQDNSLEALQSLEEQVNEYQKSGDHAAEAYTLNRLGDFYLRQDDYVKAREYYQQALIIYQSLSNLGCEAETNRPLRK